MSNTKIKVVSGLKAALVSLLTAAVGVWATGVDPFDKKTIPLWLAPLVLGWLKSAEKGVTLKKLDK